MKKFLWLAFIYTVCVGYVATAAVPSLHASPECKGGAQIEGKIEHSYCVSDEPFHFQEAEKWCNSIGLRLATIEEMCLETKETFDDNLKRFGIGTGLVCPNFADVIEASTVTGKKGDVWSSSHVYGRPSDVYTVEGDGFINVSPTFKPEQYRYLKPVTRACCFLK